MKYVTTNIVGHLGKIFFYSDLFVTIKMIFNTHNYEDIVCSIFGFSHSSPTCPTRALPSAVAIAFVVLSLFTNATMKFLLGFQMLVVNRLVDCPEFHADAVRCSARLGCRACHPSKASLNKGRRHVICTSRVVDKGRCDDCAVQRLLLHSLRPPTVAV